jgi:endonuclease-3
VLGLSWAALHVALLVAVILSAQATDVSVNKATTKLFAVANTPATLLALGEAGLTPYIRTIGLFNAKCRNIIASCRLLLDQHGGQVPRDREALEALPGVGRKTANVVLNTAFGEPTIAVDTHIFRVANRTGLAPGKTPRAVEDGLLATTPRQYRKDAHHWLILHGRYVCKARRNALSEALVDELDEGLARLQAAKVPVVILRAVQAYPGPVIAMVQGSVWGGACDLVMTCDLCVGDDSAAFAITPAKLGIPCNSTGILHFMNRLPLNITKEMFFTADLVPAERAEQFRLLAEAYPLSPAVFERIQGLRRQVYDSHDYEEGIRSSIEKRPPAFRGE